MQPAEAIEALQSKAHAYSRARLAVEVCRGRIERELLPKRALIAQLASQTEAAKAAYDKAWQDHPLASELSVLEQGVIASGNDLDDAWHEATPFKPRKTWEDEFGKVQIRVSETVTVKDPFALVRSLQENPGMVVLLKEVKVNEKGIRQALDLGVGLAGVEPLDKATFAFSPKDTPYE